MVQIVKFASDWVVFEHEDKCYFITCDHEFDSRELYEIAQMSFDQIKKKYKVTLDRKEEESSY